MEATMSDFDPTINRIPFGLLSEDEQTALIHWPHGWEFYSGPSDTWKDIEKPIWYRDYVYRGKPAPVVTSQWFNVYPQGPTANGKSKRETSDEFANEDRIAVLRIDTCNGISTAHLEEI
jgi:hypothetical protein